MAAAESAPGANLRAFADFAKLVLADSDAPALAAAIQAASEGSLTESALLSEWLPRADARVWPAFVALRETAWEGAPAQELRFSIGDRVQSNCGPVQAGGMGWQAGTIVGLWYREGPWPPAFIAPYQVQLDQNAMLIYAPVDGDGFVCRLDATPPDPMAKQKELLLGYGDSWDDAQGWMRDGFTGVHVASGMAGDAAALRQLLRRPLPLCTPNHNRNQFQETPLHMAASYGQLECAMLLLAAGHDPRIKDSYGKSATDIAAAKVETGAGANPFMRRALAALLKRWEAEAAAAAVAAGAAAASGGGKGAAA